MGSPDALLLPAIATMTLVLMLQARRTTPDA
jgi:hypothetical protein